MSKKKAVVAMSGGVDSTVTAFLAQQQGYEVTGVHLLMLPDAAPDPVLQESCRQLGIPLVERPCREIFLDRVLRPCAREYAGGRTPNPCCECNAAVKFSELLHAADELGIEPVMTGHYGRILRDREGFFRIAAAADAAKDQSYFLYRLTQPELSRILFPLGELDKTSVRMIAQKAGMLCASRPDSQDACFQIPGECCGETLCRLTGIRGREGELIYRGRIVGRHFGIHRYTIGQRQGLRVALGVPAYIRAIDASSGRIELCTDQDELACPSFCVTRVNWQKGVPPQAEEVLTVRVRYRSKGVACRMIPCIGTETIQVVPQSPIRAITPGQSAVFYDASGLLAGGGIILPPADSAC